MDLSASAKLPRDKGAEVPELPLKQPVWQSHSLWQDLISRKDKRWLVPPLEAFDNACHTYDLEIFLENFAYFLR